MQLLGRETHKSQHQQVVINVIVIRERIDLNEVLTRLNLFHS